MRTNVVVMPVYNTEKYVAQSIESVLKQTFTDFTFLIINDCSTDKSHEVITSFNDNRIVYIQNENNMKISKTLNKGLDIAKDAKYIFRMDSDDLCHPDRFMIQASYLDNNPQIGVVGTNMKIIDSDIVLNYPTNKDDVRIDMLAYNSIAHPTVAIRNEMLKKYDLKYREDIYSEDYDFWVRCNAFFEIANINEYLLSYRKHDGQWTSNQTQIEVDTNTIRNYQITHNLKIILTEHENTLLNNLILGKPLNIREINEVTKIMDILIKQNADNGYYNQEKLIVFFRKYVNKALAVYKNKFYNSKYNLSDFQEYFFSSNHFYKGDSLKKRLGVIKRLLVG